MENKIHEGAAIKVEHWRNWKEKVNDVIIFYK